MNLTPKDCAIIWYQLTRAIDKNKSNLTSLNHFLVVQGFTRTTEIEVSQLATEFSNQAKLMETAEFLETQ